jgi:hypothetical protein
MEKRIAAVEKLAGKTKATTLKTGNHKGSIDSVNRMD